MSLMATPIQLPPSSSLLRFSMAALLFPSSLQTHFLKHANNPTIAHLSLPFVKAMKLIQGKSRLCHQRQDCEVVRLAPHPKYKRRIRKKKNYQAHDPDNQFKFGDIVQLEKSKPISKNKTFLTMPVLIKNLKTKVTEDKVPKELAIPLESQQQQEA